MKKILLPLILLIPLMLNAQYWNGGELSKDLTYRIDTLKSKYLYTTISVQSSGVLTPDTIIVQSLDPFYKEWTPVAVRDLKTFGTKEYIVISGESETYLILEPYIWALRVILANSNLTGRVVKISIKGVKL